MKRQGSDMALIQPTGGECLHPVCCTSTSTENTCGGFSNRGGDALFGAIYAVCQCVEHTLLLPAMGTCALAVGQMVDARVWPDPGRLGPFSRRLLADSSRQWMVCICLLWGQGDRWMDSWGEGEGAPGKGAGVLLSDLELPLLVDVGPAWFRSQVLAWKLKMWT